MIKPNQIKSICKPRELATLNQLEANLQIAVQIIAEDTRRLTEPDSDKTLLLERINNTRAELYRIQHLITTKQYKTEPGEK
ncbi:hypothetical protein ACQ4M3_19320 [Leptolyngbya sp. AN03gr2]|uniref:hypothetical protein n=1 Tax=Leptolyngbya sp. AN03gr2 TaxID=3423364 RepID=UPI003D3203FD